MKHSIYDRYGKTEMVGDAFIILAPPLLMLIGILWFFSDEWLPNRVATGLTSFIDSFLALLTSAV